MHHPYLHMQNSGGLFHEWTDKMCETGRGHIWKMRKIKRISSSAACMVSVLVKLELAGIWQPLSCCLEAVYLENSNITRESLYI